ncbi:target of rapamycin complex 2 subunit MAPKAP1 isoform X2 [Anabrus simplex]
MDQDRKKAARIKHIKWEMNSATLTDYERVDLFERKDFRNKMKESHNVKKISLLAEQLENCPSVPRNPFLEFAKFDGNAQVGIPTRKYGIFMTMLPQAEKNYPLYVVVLASARVLDLIGLVCWKYTMEHGENVLGDNVERYGLYIAEDDGEVDWDFPCLDPKETISKFGFAYLALVERNTKDSPEDSRTEDGQREELDVIFHGTKINKVQQQEVEDLQKMKGHMSAMEAPRYQSYRVFIINKVRAKTEIQLGISGEKVEIDPVIQQKVSAKFWNRQKPVSYDMECVAACDLTDTKSNGRSTFRLVYHHASNSAGAEQASSLHNHSALASYKHHDFEADHRTAEEIVQKVNHILELSSSVRRREYLALRERKSHRRRSFHLGPR